jgi:hypothetical protein
VLWRTTLSYCAAAFAILIAVFIGSEALALKFARDSSVIARLKEAYHSGVLTPDEWPTSPYGHRLLAYDMYTECITLSMNLGNQDEPLLYRVAATPFAGFVFEGKNEPCALMAHGVLTGTIHARTPYFRYWHGAQIYARPLLANLSLAHVHILNALLLIGAMTFFAYGLNAVFGRLAAGMFLIPVLLETNLLTTPAVIVHAVNWIWTFVALGWATAWLRKHPALSPETVTFIFALGCVSNFFDVLFCPVFIPTFIAFLVLALGVRRPYVRATATLKDAAVLTSAWFTGFALTWISKWLLAVTVLNGKDVMTNILFQAGERTFAAADLADRGVFDATILTFQTAGLSVIGVCVTIAIAALVALRWPLRDSRAVARQSLLLLPLLMPIVWVEIFRDHTLYHSEFASRAFTYFATLPLLTVLNVLRCEPSASFVAFGRWTFGAHKSAATPQEPFKVEV